MPRRAPRPDRAGSFAFVAATYVLAVTAAWAVFQGLGGHPLANAAAGLLVSMGVTYGASLYADNGSVFDPYWSVLPPFVALYFAGESGKDAWTPRQLAVLAVVGCWAVRLTANWARGWPGLHHEDWRYGNLYRDWKTPKWLTLLLGVHVFPTIMIGLGCLALFPALSRGDTSFHALDGIAAVLGFLATGIELVADEQMRAFGRTARSGQVMDRGLWRYSRHPNYFGEIAFWFSLWLFALAADPGWWWTALGPFAMVAMFLFASIPMLDERSAERRPGFAEYARRTSALVPLPPRR